jgi:hypothetical protein
MLPVYQSRASTYLPVDLRDRQRRHRRLGVLLVGDGRVVQLAGRLHLLDHLLVHLHHLEGRLLLVPVVEVRVAHHRVGGDGLGQLAAVVERVGPVHAELVGTLRVRVGSQVLLVELGGGAVGRLALVERGLLLQRRLPAGLGCRVDVGGRRQQGVLGQLLRQRQRLGLSLLALYQSPPLL